jgi:imidazolonepropionase-like amidohydrolase
MTTANTITHITNIRINNFTSRICMFRNYIFCFALSIVMAAAAAADTTALVGATIHPVSQKTIENGTILFDEYGIIDLGHSVNVPAKTRQINVSGKHIYPGLISPYSQIGLIEIEAVRATDDTAETGEMNPNAVAHKAVNPDSELIPVARSNGVLYSLIAPAGRRIAGQSSLMALGGWTSEDMIVEPGVAMHMTWPRQRDNDTELRELSEFVDSARTYDNARTANNPEVKFDIRLEAMRPLIRGEQSMIVEANRIAEINSAVAFAQQHQLRLIIYGGYQADACADLLNRFDIPVILSAVYRLPESADSPYDSGYTLAARLKRAGIKFCIGGDGGTPSNLRNLPYHAATAAAYGLDRDEALKAITLYPAQIFGVDRRIGSLEIGKLASLIVTDGDPLEIPTQVEQAFIGGRQIDLDDRHKRLYRKFKQRQPD